MMQISEEEERKTILNNKTPKPLEESGLVCTNVPLGSRRGEIESCATCWPRPQSFKRQQTLLFTTFMSSLSSRGGGRDEVIEVQCAPLPYHRSHQYYPRPPHPPAVHVVLLQFLIQSLSWEVIPEALGVSLKTTCRSVRVDFNQSQRWSWKPARKVGLMTSGEKHPSPSQSFHILIYVLGGRKE